MNSSLLLTPPAIDADDEAGIPDPTKPKPMAIPVPDQVIDSGADSELHPAPEPPEASRTTPHKHRASASANTWDPSISEPAPTRNRREGWRRARNGCNRLPLCVKLPGLWGRRMMRKRIRCA